MHLIQFPLRLTIVAALIALCSSVSSLEGASITTTAQMEAKQQVSLFGAPAVTLVARGPVKFTFDVDGSGNTIPGGTSTLDAMFSGTLPSELGPPLAGLSFDLFSVDTSSLTTVDGNFVRAELTFGLTIYAAPGIVAANFYTLTPSIFQSSVISLTDLTGAVFQDPNRPSDPTAIYIGQNGLGVSEGTLVGVSFDRTVSTVPEPSTLVICSLVSVLGMTRWRRK